MVFWSECIVIVLLTILHVLLILLLYPAGVIILLYFPTLLDAANKKENSMLNSTMKMFYGKIFLWYAHILCILSKIMLLLSCKPFNYSRSSPYSDSLTWQLYITTLTYYPFMRISFKIFVTVRGLNSIIFNSLINLHTLNK